MNISHLTDQELVRVVCSRMDGTTLEDELARRLDEVLEAVKVADAAMDVLEQYGVDAMKTSDIERIKDALQVQADFPCAGELLQALMALEIDTADDLKNYLESLSQPATQE